MGALARVGGWAAPHRTAAGDRARPPRRTRGAVAGFVGFARIGDRDHAASDPGFERPILGIQSLPNVVHAARDTQAIRKLGLKPKDEILEVNGRPFVRPADLATALGDGNRVELLVRRSGKLEKLSSDVPGPELRSFPQSIAFEEGSTRIDVEAGSPPISPSSRPATGSAGSATQPSTISSRS